MIESPSARQFSAEMLALDVPLDRQPAVTIDEGLAAAYLAISGDQLPLAMSTPLSRAVTARDERLANPALALSVAIGQSTVATRRVIANLYYRDLTLLRQVHVGETLTTTVTPIAAEFTSSGTSRAKVLLDIDVHSDAGPVAHFQRLALLPVDDASRMVLRDIPAAAAEPTLASFAAVAPAWSAAAGIPRFALPVGFTVTDPLCDTVSSARELVRLTLNLAAAHRDERRGIDGRRLAYGGHTVALAQASLSRVIPGLLTVVAWRSCDHVGPVFDDDLLETTTIIEGVHGLDAGLALVDARVSVDAVRGDEHVRVLEWRPVLVVAGGEEKA